MKKSKILQNIHPYNDTFYKSCFFNSLFPILNAYGYTDLVILTNSYPLYTKKGEDFSNITISYKEELKLSEVLKNIEINMESYKFKDQIIDRIIEFINQETFVISWIDPYYINYRIDAYNKKHLEHTIVIYGYDLDKEELYVIDHTHKDILHYDYKVLSFDEFKRSYEGYLKINEEEQLREKVVYSLKVQNKKCVELNYKAIYVAYLKRNMEEILNSYEILINYFEYLSNVVSDKEFFFSNIDNCIEGVNTIINGKYVEQHKINKIFGKGNKLALEYNTIIEKWLLLRNLLVKQKLLEIYDENKSRLVKEILREIIVLEKRFLNIIMGEC